MTSQTAPTATATSQAAHFHISLNVRDLDRSVAFFEALFGQRPAKHHHDYAKFEVAEPPLVLSLEPCAAVNQGGALNHLGLRLTDAANLGAWQARLMAAGFPVQQLEGVECCYARQTKIWTHDPDGNLWEIYTLDEDIEHHGFSGGAVSAAATETASPAPPQSPAMDAAPSPAVWMHRLGEPFPTRLFAHDATIDEVRLQGTLNMTHTPEQLAQALREIVRCLKPGGVVQMHVLTSDRPLEGPLNLPGPAAVVQQVPPLDTLLDALAGAGLAHVRLTRYGSSPCFQIGEAKLRETMIEAVKPATDPATVSVLYRGPLAELRADDGTVLRRGQWCQVSQATWKQLQKAAPDAFVADGSTAAASCGTRAVHSISQ